MYEVNAPLLILGLAAGYGVLVLANRQERPLDKLGRYVGGAVLLLSVLGLICAAVCKISHMTGRCNTPGAVMQCPFSSASTPPAGSVAPASQSTPE
jgi:hypothetical protein